MYNTLMSETDNTNKNQQSPEPDTGWSYSAEQSDPVSNELNSVQASNVNPVSWTASEYIAHDKTVIWYMTVTILTLIFSGLIYFFDSNNSLFSPVLVAIAGIIFMVAASRKPKVLEYLIDDSGLHVGQKLYSYAQFKSFALVQEGPITTIVFIPLQRFVPTLTVYFDPKDQDVIVDSLSVYLPVENRKMDVIDSIMRKIRF